jgi:hypothetical protein
MATLRLQAPEGARPRSRPINPRVKFRPVDKRGAVNTQEISVTCGSNVAARRAHSPSRGPSPVADRFGLDRAIADTIPALWGGAATAA